MKICKVEDCQKTNKYKTYCPKHWYQINRMGGVKVTRYDERPAIIEGRVAKIPLGVKGRHGFAIVDKKFSYLAEHKWNLTDQGYPRTIIDGKNTKLHKLVFGKTNLSIDHINRDKLDNRLSNLREADHSQNKFNKPKQSNNKSGYKGVSKHKDKWVVWICHRGKRQYLGIYEDITQAARTYDKKAIELFGEFAYTNFNTEKT